ncbi:hypothetical protein M011DRAFT_472468 [Sporormia fimetaria CBS 119925]|uniref:Uncharacterized protein n=1 Tax=Sporormia fimetaria CBS 119925 TaxID=1340428 RepID=A0A6A6UXA0_9PLEO|nr:hypothetical protein M011DRAFT_472468 [Sporormia fimetaria CBS 119925]
MKITFKDLKQNKFVIEADGSEKVRTPAMPPRLTRLTLARLETSSRRSRQKRAGMSPSRS